MLQKNNGFILVELFLTMSVWLIIAGFLFPSFIHLLNQTYENKEKLDAMHIFYEYLQQIETEEKDYMNDVLFVNGKKYEMHWDQKSDDKWEVCIRYESIFKEEISFCESLKQ